MAVILRLARRSWAAWLLCAAAPGATAASVEVKAPLTDADNASHAVWHIEEGWQPTTVTAILQTRDCYLWLGTYNGLLRFDGVRFVVFDSANTPGLHNGRVTSLYEDSSGVLWIGHETGDLTRFENGIFQPQAPGRPWPGGAIEMMAADETGALWLLSDTGMLVRMRDGLAVECPGGASPNRKAFLTRARNGKLWVASGGLVGTLEAGRMQIFGFDDPSPAPFHQRVAAASDGGLWVMTEGRIRKWSEGRWALDLGTCPCGQGSVNLMAETRSGALLVGTLNEGVYLVVPGAQPSHFSRANGLSHNWVRSVCEDHEGNLWIGTGGGLDMLRLRKVRMLNAPDGWEGCGVLSFIVRPDGSAWIGTEGAGVYHFDRGEWESFRESSGVSNVFVWSVLETRRRELLVGTWGAGLLSRGEDRFETRGELSRITAPVVSLYEDRQGAVWIGTTIGLYRCQAGKVDWFAGKEQLQLPDVRAITQTPNGALWFGMVGGGLGVLDGATLRQFRKPDGLPSDFVQALCAETDGTLWIGTSDSGLSRLKNGKFANLSTAQGLPSEAICGIVDDGAGNLWFGSHRGIFRISKAELNRCADGAVKTVRPLAYGKAEGLASLVCSGGFQPGACKTAAGLLWFPTAKGIAIVDPVNVTSNSVSPPVVIEELLVEGQNAEEFSENRGWRLANRSSQPATPGAGTSAGTPPRPTLQIPAGRQSFEVRYTALSFTAPDKVRFKGWLEGLEHQPMDFGTKRTAQYSYLPPGTYTFRVTACNNDEVWNPVGAALSFTVLPRFWQTWWFQSAAVLAGAALVGAGVLWGTRRRVRRKLEQLERQRAVERERARIARDIHDDLGASLTRISMLSQSVRSEIEAQPQAAADVDQIYGTARELTRAMDEIVWAVNPKHDTLDSLVTYLGRFAQHFLSAAGIRCRLDVPVHLPAWALTAEIRHNVFLAFKEALHNVVKHAAASEVRISLELQAGGFILAVADNGRGFDRSRLQEPAAASLESARLAAGNGLPNMRRRLEEIGGRCEWNTAPGEGTKVKLNVVVR